VAAAGLHLELRFRRQAGSTADDVVIWVEVKHGTSPHEHQLSNYISDLAGLNVRARAVVLLAPAGRIRLQTLSPHRLT
jgi:hypothetical protein